MPVCRKCDVKFPNSMVVDGKARNMQRRKFCVSCSPFGTHNTKPSFETMPGLILTEKRCPVCAILKPISSFYHKKDRKNGNAYCKDCFNDYQSVRGVIKKIKAIEYLGNKCKECGITNIHPTLYDFHHRNPNEKDSDWSRLRLMSEANINQELDKCDLLCVFCHRLKHLNHNTWQQAFAQLNYQYQYPRQDLNL